MKISMIPHKDDWLRTIFSHPPICELCNAQLYITKTTPHLIEQVRCGKCGRHYHVHDGQPPHIHGPHKDIQQ